jgi:histidinol-phosphate/aromatic aminotransferase/cobyric acid decarboxylase-like protein
MLDPTVLAETVTGRKNAMLCMTFPATNPLQTPITRQHLKAVIAANPDITILLDGAYRQFGDHQQLATLALQYPQVIYMQVASKDLHLPGARLSWVVPSKRHAARLMASAAPYPLNSGAVGQVMAMLRRHDLIAELHEQQRLARDHLAKALGRVGLPILRGAGPWVLLKWPTDAATLVRDLERRFAILVQQQTMPPLDNSWIRISATVPHEARRITSAISALIGEKLAV